MSRFAEAIIYRPYHMLIADPRRLRFIFDKGHQPAINYGICRSTVSAMLSARRHNLRVIVLHLNHFRGPLREDTVICRPLRGRAAGLWRPMAG